MEPDIKKFRVGSCLIGWCSSVFFGVNLGNFRMGG